MNKQYKVKDLKNMSGIYKDINTNLYLMVINNRGRWFLLEDLNYTYNYIKNGRGWKNFHNYNETVIKTNLYKGYFSKLGRLLNKI